MNMFPHTVTLYNVSIETDKSTYEDKMTNHITILRGVMLDAVKAVNVRESGLEGADAVTLYVPFSVEAVDGVTGEAKTYLPPGAYWESGEKGKHWTFSVSSKLPDADSNTFFVKGEAVEPESDVDKIEMLYDHVYDLTKIDEKDYGGHMSHWEIGGK